MAQEPSGKRRDPWKPDAFAIKQAEFLYRAESTYVASSMSDLTLTEPRVKECGSFTGL